MGRKGEALVIEGPSASCGYCRFTSALHGTWSVEDGLLVWRGAPDPQPRRGPDLDGCCEGRGCGEFTGITADGQVLGGEDVAALRASAADARLHEFDDWPGR